VGPMWMRILIEFSDSLFVVGLVVVVLINWCKLAVLCVLVSLFSVYPTFTPIYRAVRERSATATSAGPNCRGRTNKNNSKRCG
jgi:hypothetical protein